MRAAAESSIDVLLTGETGTGKELMAAVIHRSGGRRTKQLVTINCAATPTDLFEAELFGIRGRVATGVDPRPGRLLSADGGTVFLDEVGELAPSSQAKLLRLLQEREVHAIGASSPQRLDFRVIAATNRNLREEVSLERFRADLFFRLCGLELHIPPLRRRKEDIPELAIAFLHRTCGESKKDIRGLTRHALDVLLSYDWPGNVRELEMNIRRAVLLCPEGGSIGAELVSAESMIPRSDATASRSDSYPGESHSGPARTTRSVVRQLYDHELAVIETALAASGGNQTEAARRLGLKRTTLAMRLNRHRARGRRTESICE